jgi:predicted RNA-binding Zn-ribbon protein involved in translation (DUF1610 family)
VKPAVAQLLGWFIRKVEQSEQGMYTKLCLTCNGTLRSRVHTTTYTCTEGNVWINICYSGRQSSCSMSTIAST